MNVSLEFIKGLKEDIRLIYLTLSINYRHTGVTTSREGYFFMIQKNIFRLIFPLILERL